MRSVSCLLLLSIAATVAMMAVRAAEPDEAYAQRSYHDTVLGLSMSVTQEPLVVSPSEVFVVGNVYHGDAFYAHQTVAHVDITRGLTHILPTSAFSGVKPLNLQAPLYLTKTSALFYSNHPSNSVAFVVSSRQLSQTNRTVVWSLNRHGAVGGITTWINLAYVPMGNHMDAHGRLHTALAAVNLATGVVEWEIPFQPDSIVGTPVISDDGQVLVMVNDTLWSVPQQQSNSSNSYFTLPCGGMQAVSGTQLTLQLVPYAYDKQKFTMLNTLLVYGQVQNPNDPSDPSQFTVCRIHHGSGNFGQSEWKYSWMEQYTVLQVSGGGGFIFMSVKKSTATGADYFVNVFNGSESRGQTLVTRLSRTAADASSHPSVMWHPVGATERVLMTMQWRGKLTAFDLYGHPPLNQAWSIDKPCKYTPSPYGVGNRSWGFCVTDNQEAYAFDANGGIVWSRWGVKANYPAIPFKGTTVFFPSDDAMTSLTIEPSPTNAPGPAHSTGAGVAVLIVMIAIFVVIIVVAIVKSFKAKRGGGLRSLSSRSEAELGKDEGYAGLNP